VLGTVIVVAAREPDSVGRVVNDALAGLGYVANWREMAADVSYADRFDGGVQPLAHLWSLSIEEQLYIVVLLIVGWWGVRRAGWLAGIAIAVGVFIWRGSPDAYFSTPVRVAEVFAIPAAAVALAATLMR